MTYDVAFVDPATGVTLTANPFELDTYLQGCKVTSTLTLQEMMKDWKKPCVYTFTYDAPGPLASLLSPNGQPLPNPIVVEATLGDFVSLLTGKPKPGLFAPFNLLTDVVMDGRGVLLRHMDDTDVQFDLAVDRTPLVALAKNGAAMHIAGLKARNQEWQMQGAAGQLQFLHMGSLAGVLMQTVSKVDGAKELGLHHDFGAGSAYPQAIWQCR